MFRIATSTEDLRTDAQPDPILPNYAFVPKPEKVIAQAASGGYLAFFRTFEDWRRKGWALTALGRRLAHKIRCCGPVCPRLPGNGFRTRCGNKGLQPPAEGPDPRSTVLIPART
jgi:hypothetical protein